MHDGVRHLHQRSPLSVVLVVSLVALLAASILVVVGVTKLLGLEGEGAVGSFPFVGRLF